MRRLEKTAFIIFSFLFLVSVFGGPQFLAGLGLAFLGRWGAPVLWFAFVAYLRFRDVSLRGFVRWRSEWVLVVGLTFSLFLRWPIAGHDLRHFIGPDEGEVVENTLEILKTGDFHQRHPGYPGLLFYVQLVPATGHLFRAAASGEGRSVSDLPREGFYLAARRTTLLAGWLAALAVFFLGRDWLGRPAAVLASTLVAMSPLAFRVSREVSPDLLLMLFVTVGLGLILRTLDEPETKRFIWAGIGLGLAAAIKYTGAVLAAPYFVAWLLGSAPRRTIGKAALGVVGSVVAFAVTSPFTFLDLPNFYRGMTAHLGYYQAAEANVPGEFSRILATSGLGLAAAIAAFGASLWILIRLEKRGLVMLSFPIAYFVLFSFFHRGFPRHAVVVLPACALLAARGAKWCFEPTLLKTRSRWISYTVVCVLLAQPVVGSIRLAAAVSRPTPADRAKEWVEANLPEGDRILEDQFTPRFDRGRYEVHRLRVEEKVFAGNYDWVLSSGYPPGLPLKGLRRVQSFKKEKSLGNAIQLYEVPPRESLMGKTLSQERGEAHLGAGELSYFGDGWFAPSGGAFGTSRLSDGELSEVFFVLGDAEPRQAILARFNLSSALPDAGVLKAHIELNGEPVGPIEIRGERPRYQDTTLPRRSLQSGLNRLVLRYGRTARLDRRHRQVAIRLFGLNLEIKR